MHFGTGLGEPSLNRVISHEDSFGADGELHGGARSLRCACVQVRRIAFNHEIAEGVRPQRLNQGDNHP